MSLDLFVVREKELAWKEARRACSAVAKVHDGLSFWEMTDDAQSTDAYFWNVDRVSVSFVSPDANDVQEGDPPELAKPFVEISSRSGAWPWIEWVALTLAQELGARVFDPQNAEMYEATVPEHDFQALRRLHDEYLREAKPTLRSSWWARTRVTDATPAGLRPLVEAFEQVARDVLGIAKRIDLTDAQINLWHTYSVDGAELKVSTGLDDSPLGLVRSFNVEGPPGDTRASAYAEELARRLNLRFRRVDEYRRR
jgi:hypothetical protein